MIVFKNISQLRALLATRLQFEMVSFSAVLFIFSLIIIHIASLLYNYDKNKPREATRVTENGKYPLKVQASARCWPLTNVVESSVKDWMVVRECGKRREK